MRSEVKTSDELQAKKGPDESSRRGRISIFAKALEHRVYVTGRGVVE